MNDDIPKIDVEFILPSIKFNRNRPKGCNMKALHKAAIIRHNMDKYGCWRCDRFDVCKKLTCPYEVQR